jgi:hypothetical protein
MKMTTPVECPDEASGYSSKDVLTDEKQASYGSREEIRSFMVHQPCIASRCKARLVAALLSEGDL